MGKYIVKRIGVAIFTLFIVASLTFFIMQMVPGNPFMNEKVQSQEVLDALNKKYGLDKPVMVQYKNYMVNLVQGDLGVSYKIQKNVPVTTIIKEAFPTSAKIGLLAIAFAISVGIPLGSLAALNRGKFADNIIRIVATAGIAIPGFVVATVSMILFSVKLGWLPTYGLSSWQGYILPVFTLGFYPMCYIARLMRSSMLETIGQEYIRTAKAKGMSLASVTFKHSLKNSLIPVITYIGPMTASVLTGAFVVEKVFNIPGLGRYFIKAIEARDYPMIMGTTIFLAFLVIVMNLICDVLYKVVDPRIKLD